MHLVGLYTYFKMMHGAYSVILIILPLWPAGSLDLTPFDYYLWGSLKDDAYENKPHREKNLEKSSGAYWALDWTRASDSR